MSNTKRWLMGFAYGAVVVLVILAAVAFMQDVVLGAQSVMVSVPIDNVVRGDEGDIKPARDPVPVSELGIAIGQECLVALVGFNPGSEHPGNDQILSTGGATLVAPDFEEFKGKVTSVSAVMIMGEFVTFDVLLGEDEVSSGGLTATFDCPPPPPPTTTTTVAPATTTTVAPVTTTTQPSVTTTTMENWPTTTTAAPTTTTTAAPTTSIIPVPTTVPDSPTITIETPVGAVPAGGGACAGEACVVAQAAFSLGQVPRFVWVALGALLLMLALAVLAERSIWKGIARLRKRT